jgi:hypothetical protein
MDLKELPTRSFARHPWEIVRADFFLRLLGRAGQGRGAFRARYRGWRWLFCRAAAGDFSRRWRGSHASTWPTMRRGCKAKAGGDPRLAFTTTKPEGRFGLRAHARRARTRGRRPGSTARHRFQLPRAWGLAAGQRASLRDAVLAPRRAPGPQAALHARSSARPGRRKRASPSSSTASSSPACSCRAPWSSSASWHC